MTAISTGCRNHNPGVVKAVLIALINRVLAEFVTVDGRRMRNAGQRQDLCMHSRRRGIRGQAAHLDVLNDL